MAGEDVFVSYSTRDKAAADTVVSALEGHGIRCWVAPRDIRPGHDWSDAIIDAIAECRVFLLLLSAGSNQSEQVKRELQNAVSEAKAILPVRTEEVTLSRHMRYFIGTPHWLDAITPPLESHLPKLIATVSECLSSRQDRETEPLPALLPASPVPAAPAIHAVSADILAAGEKALAHFIGPMARVLAKRGACEATGAADFHRRLSEHLSTPAEKAEFLRRVQK